ncbi:MAG: helix-turn-helix domain-containing protein [Microbacteriaceae bacterium]|nr:helix-turn-helix domain-containing protein [Microbacteriaceae bacterium]
MKGRASEYALSSVERALAALDLLAKNPGARLNEVAAALGSSPSTVLRMLRVLERSGHVRRSARAPGYLLGPRVAELGRAFLAGIDVIADIRPNVAPLGREFNLTVHLGLLRAGMLTVIDKIDPPDPIVRYSTLGTRMPLHATAAGKAVLALLPDELDSLRDIDLVSYTPSTRTAFHELVADVSLAQQRRFGVEEEEFQVGFSCVGTAFAIGQDVYSVSLSGAQDSRALLARGERLSKGVSEVVAGYGALASVL